MMATADALQFLLKGDQIRLDRAKTDERSSTPSCRPRTSVKAAKDWIKAGGKSKQPWDVDGFKLPGGPVWSKMGMMTFPAANALYRKETQDNYPGGARHHELRVRGPAGAVRHRAAHRVALFRQGRALAEAAAMIRSLFVSMQELNKGARRPKASPATN
jgi:3-hydroxyacyl-CoA dehydrogenase/enoyl-CoA hydratase/3-hydroxybutyryl-CoA epimerase